VRAIILILFLNMGLLANLKSFVAQRMSLAAWSQAWQRGDDVTGGGSGAGLSQPYAQSVWVQRAIKRVADPITAVDLEFFEAGAEEKEIADPKLRAFWSKPGLDRSGAMSRADFIMATVGWWKLAGEFFWLLGDEWIVPRSVGGPMLIARPDRMRPLLENNALAGWEFTDAANKKHYLVREQVVHVKAWNPYDDLRGLSEWESAKIAAQSDYAAGRFALNLAAANGDRGVIVVAKGGMPSDQQQAQITASLREKAAAARRGSFRPIFLTGDVAIEDPKISAPDANFVAARLENRHEIALAFGVPPSMFDVKAAYSEGASSDRYLLIADTCRPLAEKIEDAIEIVSSRLLGREVEACFRWEDHDVMQAVRRARMDGVGKLWGVGVPMAQINDALDLGLKPFAGWEKSYLPFSVQEVGTEIALPTSDQPLELPAPAEEDPVMVMLRAVEALDPIAQMQRAVEGLTTCPKCGHAFDYAAEPESAMGAVNCPKCGATMDQEGHALAAPRPALRIAGDCACRFPTARELEHKAGDSARVKLWKAHMRARLSAVKRCRSKISKVLMTARTETLRKIEAGATKGLTTRAMAADFLFNLATFKSALLGEMRKAALATLDEAGGELLREIGDDDVFTMPPARAQKFLAQRENLLSGVADDVFERTRRELQAGMDKGESTAKLAARIKDEFNGIDAGRAVTVAQTETGAAYGVARQEAMDQAGVDWKEWLTSGLDNVRATHLEAEGQRVRTNDAFKIGTANLVAPGVPFSPEDNDPGEIINCHCVAIAVEDGGTA
jgi:HK97 family phage portal protein